VPRSLVSLRARRFGGALATLLAAVALGADTLGSAPSDPEGAALRERGAAVFAAKGCGDCHALAGVAAGTHAPDLTGLARRRQLAGGLTNNVDNLRRWLRNPQGIKPGSYMPNLWRRDDPEAAAEIEAVIAFLLSHTPPE
jgi:cytochrome c1